MRFQPVFNDTEGAILLAMYEVENGTYTSYTLAWKLNPTVQVPSPPASLAFAETRDATERLIGRSLVRGERHSGADGVYFNKLKLTPKGEKMAIHQRETAEKRKKAQVESDSLTADIKKLMGEK
jgi:hypothetical protein